MPLLEIGSVQADGQFYDAARMLGAQQAFAPSRRGLYLRGLQPQVLALRQLLTLTLRLARSQGLHAWDNRAGRAPCAASTPPSPPHPPGFALGAHTWPR